MKDRKVALVTGGFDPLHDGHLALFRHAREYGDYLFVGVNSDYWLERKKGKAFMEKETRLNIIKELSCVDNALFFDDRDGTAIDAIHKCLRWYSKVVFVNGGDRTEKNTPEFDTFKDNGRVEFVWEVGGGDKKNSSSSILENWKSPKTIRPWGYYRELYEGKDFKVKELVINPHSSLSMQRHQYRSETWNLVSGNCSVRMIDMNRRLLHTQRVISTFEIPKFTWHQGTNMSDEPSHVVEIWRGDSGQLSETDIERIDIDAVEKLIQSGIRPD
tara:strand:- start:817 stop:1632 length:816 start_codon:yes stop_codon:yes gene_type:complete